MRADRLLSMLMLLQSRGSMTASDLAAELEVSERTIYRDMTALSAAGVPVYAEPIVSFLRQAALDPDVLAIKMTLYRIDVNSPLVEALIEALRTGSTLRPWSN